MLKEFLVLFSVFVLLVDNCTALPLENSRADHVLVLTPEENVQIREEGESLEPAATGWKRGGWYGGHASQGYAYGGRVPPHFGGSILGGGGHGGHYGAHYSSHEFYHQSGKPWGWKGK